MSVFRSQNALNERVELGVWAPGREMTNKVLNPGKLKTMRNRTRVSRDITRTLGRGGEQTAISWEHSNEAPSPFPSHQGKPGAVLSP